MHLALVSTSFETHFNAPGGVLAAKPILGLSRDHGGLSELCSRNLLVNLILDI